ncbi:hypothetical protein DH2020_032977 [Rehmannia glutinosa]|uniref:Uncharacterized protein n=1 Tax=Rehmannia glutinosa TaxID=99300 RepID=A0ABR0VDP8_REHGL
MNKKLEDVRKLLIKSREEESLIFVDAIQRLGVGHHYQEEIDTILTQNYVKTRDSIHGYHSLHDIALSFRLLRQRGYHVSADVFNNFKGKDGRFRGKLRHDIRGLLELYEATQISFEGENILDEAQQFSSQLLYDFLPADYTDSKWSNIVSTRLRYPYQKTITRMTEKNFLRDLESMDGWGKTLGELAKMDLLIGQSVYQEELLQVSKWWNDLGLTKELKLARNQPIKWYTCSMAILINDISLNVQRVQLSKSIAFIYLIDDIFDLYGTLDELAIFTDAIDKWDYASIDMLPDYMKACYKTLLDTTNEIGHTILKKYGYNPINSLKQTWKNLCSAYIVEAKWFGSGDLPSAEDYLANGKVSSGVHVVLVHLFFLLGLGGNNEGAISLNDTSKLMSSVAAILRLWNDLGSAKDEHQNGDEGSYIECYMKDHPDLPYKQVRKHMINMIAIEWKRLNKECFNLNDDSSVISSFQEASLNLARIVPLMYSYDDNQRLPVLEEYINLMLLNQTSLEQHQTKQEHVF